MFDTILTVMSLNMCTVITNMTSYNSTRVINILYNKWEPYKYFMEMKMVHWAFCSPSVAPYPMHMDGWWWYFSLRFLIFCELFVIALFRIFSLKNQIYKRKWKKLLSNDWSSVQQAEDCLEVGSICRLRGFADQRAKDWVRQLEFMRRGHKNNGRWNLLVWISIEKVVAL